MSPVYTIGHSTRRLEDFIALLKVHGISLVADIRTVPRSRHNPQFNRESLPRPLEQAGIQYTHMAGLGGLRHPRPDSPNAGWKNASFRGFADYVQTVEFEQSLQELVKLAGKEIVAVMCAEAVPWRCHRSLIADALLTREISVVHIIGQGSERPHQLTPWAKVENGRLSYPAPTHPVA